jgi:hypothetical protein
VITTYNYGGDAMVGWIPFCKIISIFVFKKDTFEVRIDFLLKFLNVVSSYINAEDKEDEDALINNDCRVLKELQMPNLMQLKLQKF